MASKLNGIEGQMFFACFSSGVGACALLFTLMTEAQLAQVNGVVFLDGEPNADLPMDFFQQHESLFPVREPSSYLGVGFQTVYMTDITKKLEINLTDSFLIKRAPMDGVDISNDWARHLYMTEDMTISNEVLTRWGLK